MVSLDIPMNCPHLNTSTLKIFYDFLLSMFAEVFRLKISTQKIDRLSNKSSFFIAVKAHKFFKNVEKDYSISYCLILLVLKLLFIQDKVCSLY